MASSGIGGVSNAAQHTQAKAAAPKVKNQGGNHDNAIGGVAPAKHAPAAETQAAGKGNNVNAKV